jgi:hypothetical protein
MSGKSIVVLAALAFAGWHLTRTNPPVHAGASAADSAAVAKAGFGARFEYGIGMLGGKVMGGVVRGNVSANEQTLKDLKVALKNSKGPDGDRARKFSLKVIEMDKKAMDDLQYGHPIRAMRGSMEAKSVLNAVREQLRNS